MSHFPRKQANRSSAHRALMLASVALVLGAWTVPAMPGDLMAERNVEVVRQQVLEFVNLQVSALDALGQVQPVSPSIRSTLEYQYQTVATMSASELQTFVDAEIPLAYLNDELRILISDLELALEQSELPSRLASFTGDKSVSGPSAAFDPAPVTSGAPRMDPIYPCPAADPTGIEKGAYVRPGTALFSPPGYCHQTDDIPITRDKDGVATDTHEYRLSDVEVYPYICFVNTPPTVLVPAEVLFGFLRGTTRIIELACQEEKGGFNTSIFCAPLIVTLQALVGILEEFRACNVERRGAELQTVYARMGETFAQGNAHHTDLTKLDSLIKTATTELERHVDTDVTIIGDEITDGLNEGFGNIADRASAVEAKIGENALKVESARNNSDIIKYKIWCDQQRENLKPSNCH